MGKETTSEHTTSRWLEKFRTGNTSLEDEGRGRPSDIDNQINNDNDQLRAIIEANSRKTTRETFEELKVDHSRHLRQRGKDKKVDKWMPHD